MGTAAATEDCRIEVRLIEGFRAEDLLADWDCDADTTIPRPVSCQRIHSGFQRKIFLVFLSGGLDKNTPNLL